MDFVVFLYTVGMSSQNVASSYDTLVYHNFPMIKYLAQSAGTVEYTDCISAEE